MNPELANITEFLGNCLPFDSLLPEALARTANQLQVQYVRRGHHFVSPDDLSGLYIIRSGAVDIFGENNQLLDRVEEHESFRVSDEKSKCSGAIIRAEEDSLLYCLPEPDYLSLRAEYRHIDRFFHGQRNRRVRRAVRQQTESSVLMRPVSEVMSRTLLTAAPMETVQTVAEKMTEARVSSALILEQGTLVGIVTDRDLRSRVLAQGLSAEAPVSAIMTPNPRYLERDTTLFDAVLLMARSRIHHLPIQDSGSVVGLLSSSDILLAREDEPVFFIKRIARQNTVEALSDLSEQLPALLASWVDSAIPAEKIGHLFSTISDSFTKRLIELALDDLGEAPAEFCWLCFGSQAREEQILGSDQDNALLIADDVSEETRRWFEKLAHFVCDGLNACGYDYCNGGVMATTPEWRQTLTGWKHTVDCWMRAPTPDAVMRVSIFFDVRAVYGSEKLCGELQTHMLSQTARNSIFIASLTENALDSSPPLGLFRQFVLERDGQHRNQIDLKKRGSLPIVELARVHALANGLPEVGTLPRLKALVTKGVMSLVDSRNLQDAFNLVMQMRIERQRDQIRRNEPVDYFCSPDDLSRLSRRHLRDAFGVVHDSQTALRNNYRQGMG